MSLIAFPVLIRLVEDEAAQQRKSMAALINLSADPLASTRCFVRALTCLNPFLLVARQPCKLARILERGASSKESDDGADADETKSDMSRGEMGSQNAELHF